MKTQKVTPKYWRKNSSLKTVQIVIKEWFDKVNGNTYFSAVATLNGEYKVKIPFQYGYGSHAIDKTARKLLADGWTAVSIHHWSDCEKAGIKVDDTSIENCLQKDVKAWGAESFNLGSEL